MVFGNAVSLESHIYIYTWSHWVLVLAEAAQAHEFPLICHCVKLPEYTVGGGVEISTLLSAALSALQNF